MQLVCYCTSASFKVDGKMLTDCESDKIELKEGAEEVWRHIHQPRERWEREVGGGFELRGERELNAVQPLCAVEQQPVRH